MLRRVSATLCAIGVLGWSGVASAQETTFTSTRPLVVSLEHLGGVTYTRLEPDGGDAESLYQAGTFISLTPLTAGGVARLGVHYFVAPSFSVGGLLNYTDNDTLGTFLLAGGRVGVAFPIGETTTLWLRGGALYWRNKLEVGPFELTYSAVVPGGELLFAFEPIEHFGVMLGPMFEMGFGKQEQKVPGDTQKADFKYIEAGLSVGFFTDW